MSDNELLIEQYPDCWSCDSFYACKLAGVLRKDCEKYEREM